MYACRNQTFFFTFPISKELNFQKKNDEHGFLSYIKHYLSKKSAADDDAYLGWGWSKI